MKKSILAIIIALLALSFTGTEDKGSKRKLKILAKEYFEAFHNGELEKVYTYLSDDCVIKVSTNEPRNAKEFLKTSAEFISTLTFRTKAMYTSTTTNNVIIDFSFTTPEDKQGRSKTIDAIDIIEFDINKKIKKIQVITND